MKCSRTTIRKLYKTAAASVLLMSIMLLATIIHCVWLDHKLIVLQKQKDTLESSLRALETEQVSSEELEEVQQPQMEILQLRVPSQHEDAVIDVPVTLVLPGNYETTCPLVLCCHGFTGDRNLDGHFNPLAEQLAAQGIACATLDFSGNGESSEPFTAYTLSHMEQDIDVVLEYLKNNYPINAEKIGLLGHSMGGRVVALHLNNGIAAAALWSPAAAPGLDGLEFLAHDENERSELYQSVLAQGTLEIHGWNAVISSAFVSEMADSDPWQAITDYRGKLLVAFSAGDEEILSQETIDGTLAAAHARKMNFVNLYGQFYDATHNYTGTEGADDGAVRARIETQTSKFFLETLL